MAQGSEPGRCLLPGDQVGRRRPFRPSRSKNSATTSPFTGRRASTASPSSPSARSTRWPCAACRATRPTTTRATSRWWCPPTADGVVRVGNLYLPNGNPIGTDKFTYKLAWMRRLKERASDLLRLEEPFVLLGDYNVIPEPVDAKNPQAWTEDALFQPETRAAYRSLLNLGLMDAVRACHPSAGPLHVLGLPGRRLAEGPRHPHRPHPGLAPGGRSARRSRHRQVHARLGEAVRSRAGVDRARRLTACTVSMRRADRRPCGYFLMAAASGPLAARYPSGIVLPFTTSRGAGGKGAAAARCAGRARRMATVSPFEHCRSGCISRPPSPTRSARSAAGRANILRHRAMSPSASLRVPCVVAQNMLW